MRWLGLPLWAATALVLALLLPPPILKWRVDRRRYGRIRDGDLHPGDGPGLSFA